MSRDLRWAVTCEGPFSASRGITRVGRSPSCRGGDNSSGEINCGSRFIIIVVGRGVDVALSASLRSLTQRGGERQLRGRATGAGTGVGPSHSTGLVPSPARVPSGRTRTERFCPSLSPGVTRTPVSEGAGCRERGRSRDSPLSRGSPCCQRDSSVAGGRGSPLPPPSAARQSPSCTARCPYKGREKLKNALSERFLPPFRPSRSALAMAAARRHAAARCQSQEGPWMLLNCIFPVLSTGAVSASWSPVLLPSITPMLVPRSDCHGEACWGAGTPAGWEHPPWTCVLG